ncbi:MAG: class I SAM-dependent methyltransferase [Rhodothermales bacterium]
MRSECPNCSSGALETFYKVPRVPVHSVLLLKDQREARSFPTGSIALGYCGVCGFIGNKAFDGSLLNYSREYEETQGFSPTFNRFHERLARDLIERHDLHGKRVIEIGCGKGDFLNMVCALGDNTGIGFDPSYIPERDSGAGEGRATFVQDFYSEAYADRVADFVCCKMTLEHIPNTGAFIRTVRRALDAQPEALVFFQIPDTRRVLGEGAFWDVYYEHCSYFSPESLDVLFRRAGFRPLRTWTDYDDQYLMIEAVPDAPDHDRLPDLTELRSLVDRFAGTIQGVLTDWRSRLAAWRDRGERVVLWGGGSKAVAFVTTLGVGDEIACAVDINPYKHGSFLAGTGHPVVGPDALIADPPDRVIVMNPVYMEEIRRSLDERGLRPALEPITEYA